MELPYDQESSIQSINSPVDLVMDTILSNFSFPDCIQNMRFILGGVATKAD